jgi:hypothetical protein
MSTPEKQLEQAAEKPSTKSRVAAYIAIVWGALILPGILFVPAQASTSYRTGTLIGTLFGVALLVWGVSKLRQRK